MSSRQGEDFCTSHRGDETWDTYLKAMLGTAGQQGQFTFVTSDFGSSFLHPRSGKSVCGFDVVRDERRMGTHPK